MKVLSIILIALFISLLFIGCGVGHQDWVNIKNSNVGKRASNDNYRFESFGKIIGGFRKGGYGITHITYDKDDNIIQHWDYYKILPKYPYKEIVGKCKIYEIVDPKTRIMKSWGYEPDANPLSCRTWM